MIVSIALGSRNISPVLVSATRFPTCTYPGYGSVVIISERIATRQYDGTSSSNMFRQNKYSHFGEPNVVMNNSVTSKLSTMLRLLIVDSAPPNE